MEKLNSIEKIISSISKLIPLSSKEIGILKNNLVQKTVKANQILLSKESVCDFEAFIEKGILRSYYTIDGNERILNFFVENQWISDFKSFTLQKPTKITIQAIEDSELIVFNYSQMKLLSHEISGWDKLGKIFFQKLFVQTFNHLESLLINSPEERYADLLKSRPDLINRIPQYYIAQYVGVQPESLSRIRKRVTIKDLS